MIQVTMMRSNQDEPEVFTTIMTRMSEVCEGNGKEDSQPIKSAVPELPIIKKGVRGEVMVEKKPQDKA